MTRNRSRAVGVIVLAGAIVVSFVVVVLRSTIEPEQRADAPAVAQDQKLRLVNFDWRKGGFGTVMIATLTIENPNAFRIKDIDVACELTAKSGTAISYTAATIYDVIPARARRIIRELNMGSGFTTDFNQVEAASCKLSRFSRG